MTVENRSAIWPADRLIINTQTTRRYAEMMLSASETERWAKKVRLAACRIEVQESGPAKLVCGLPGPFPAPGIQRSLADAFVSVGGKPIRGDQGMRDALQIRPVVEVLRDVELGTQCWMWTGLGNVGMNQYCVAWQDGELYYSVQDRLLLETGYEFDGCMWIKDDGWKVLFERVRFVRSGNAWQPFVNGKPANNAHLIVCGQRLVERGVAIDPTNAAHSRYAASYIDKRHLVLNAYAQMTPRPTSAADPSQMGTPIQRDFGLDQILARPELLKAAIEGDIVPLNLELRDVDGELYDVAQVALEAALLDKSYRLFESRDEFLTAHRVGERGLVFIDPGGRTCEIVYRVSPYPLHFLAVKENGAAILFDAVVGGFSNNAGCTVTSLAADLVAGGYTEALLLDNGGDVTMVSRAANAAAWPNPNDLSALVPSSLRRTQWAAMLVYQGSSGRGLEVRCDEVGQCGRFAIEWS